MIIKGNISILTTAYIIKTLTIKFFSCLVSDKSLWIALYSVNKILVRQVIVNLLMKTDEKLQNFIWDEKILQKKESKWINKLEN